MERELDSMSALASESNAQLRCRAVHAPTAPAYMMLLDCPDDRA